MKKELFLLKCTALNQIAAVLLFAITMLPGTAFAQQTFYRSLASGNTIVVNVTGSKTICAPSSATIIQNSSNSLNVTAADLSMNEATYFSVNAGQPCFVQITFPNPLAGVLITEKRFKYGTIGGEIKEGYIGEGTGAILLPVLFELGAKQAYVAFKFEEYVLFHNYHNWLVIPFTVLGPTTQEVPIMGVTVQPKIPYLVLHAPPGDGSFSEFQDTKTTCREFSDTYAQDGSNSANATVKIGAEGSAGFIVTTDFEFSVSMSAGVTAGDLSIKTGSNQTCVTVGEGFATTELSGPNGGGDVFIGYGTDIQYGIYPYYKLDQANCKTVLDTGLIYHPVGEPRRFAYTKNAILAEIASLSEVVAQSGTLGAKAANDAQNQIDVWNRVLDMNEANVTNPNNEVLGAVGFSSGVSNTQESSITVLNTNSIETEHYIEGTIGVEAVVETGGSGISGGYEYKSSKRFGKTQNQTDEASKVVRYTLADDDAGDTYNLQVVRDPMYGTPIFRVQPGTRSSCPYQGGYQRDQPKLKHEGTLNDHINLSNIPVGTSATFKLDICNASNETRKYNLKLDAASNLHGAVVSAAGVPLNGNDLGQSFNIAANSCIEDLVVEVKMQSINSPLDYPNLQLFLYSDCEEDIQSSVFASVFFENLTRVNDVQGAIGQLSIFPSPASSLVNVRVDLTEAAPVRIDLYDMLGRLQVSGVEERLPVGNHQKQVDVSDMPPGIYAMVVQSADIRVSRKLVIER